GMEWESPTPGETLHPIREKRRPPAPALETWALGPTIVAPRTAPRPPRGVPPMAPDESVTHWLGLLQGGDAAAAQRLWQRSSHRLGGLARAKLQGGPRRAADEEDVALSAFASFCRAAEAGRFPQLEDRHDLWRLLVTLTERKACNLVRDQRRQKRGGGAVLGGAGAVLPGRSSRGGRERLSTREATPG